MTYTILKAPVAWWPVAWDGVGEDGAPIKCQFEMRFRLLKVDAVVDFMTEVETVREKEGTAGRDLAKLYAGLIEKVSTDWRGVLAENGDPVPFATDALTQMMNEPGMFARVFDAFRDCINGRHEARAGN